MYKIQWRHHQTRSGLLSQTVAGLSQYPNREAAERQVAIFTRLFPNNTYYIEPN